MRVAAFDTGLKGRGRTPDGVEVPAFKARARIDRRDLGLRSHTLETGSVLVCDTDGPLLEGEAPRQEWRCGGDMHGRRRSTGSAATL